MENISKVLILAGGVLLGVLLIAVMIFIFRNGAEVNKTYDTKAKSQEIQQYNSKFLKLQGEESNIYDVLTIANFARSANASIGNDESADDYIKVEFNGIRLDNLSDKDYYENMYGEDGKSGWLYMYYDNGANKLKYDMVIKGYTSDGKVNSVAFK